MALVMNGRSIGEVSYGGRSISEMWFGPHLVWSSARVEFFRTFDPIPLAKAWQPVGTVTLRKPGMVFVGSLDTTSGTFWSSPSPAWRFTNGSDQRTVEFYGSPLPGQGRTVSLPAGEWTVEVSGVNNRSSTQLVDTVIAHTPKWETIPIDMSGLSGTGVAHSLATVVVPDGEERLIVVDGTSTTSNLEPAMPQFRIGDRVSRIFRTGGVSHWNVVTETTSVEIVTNGNTPGTVVGFSGNVYTLPVPQ